MLCLSSLSSVVSAGRFLALELAVPFPLGVLLPRLSQCLFRVALCLSARRSVISAGHFLAKEFAVLFRSVFCYPGSDLRTLRIRILGLRPLWLKDLDQECEFLKSVGQTPADTVPFPRGALSLCTSQCFFRRPLFSSRTRCAFSARCFATPAFTVPFPRGALSLCT